MKPSGVLIVAAATACVLAGAGLSRAAAQSIGADADITGSWTFETTVYEEVCKMTGELEVRPGPRPGVYEGRLVAFESCIGRPHYEAEQTARLLREGEQLKIESKIVRVLPSAEFYAPDDFALTIVDGSLMIGELRSADIAPVTFRRRNPLIG